MTDPAATAPTAFDEPLSSNDDALLSVFAGEAFTTAVLARLDTDTGRPERVSAGHPERC